MSSVPLKFKGYAAHNVEDGKQVKVSPIEFEPPPLGEEDVTVKVECCGVCFSDIHVMRKEWWDTQYPFIGGHEVIGEVVEVGNRVKGLAKGQRVGIGWLAGACLNCARCIRAKDQYCKQNQPTIQNRPGGFADYVRVSSHYAFPIPDNLPSEDAAPLMCAGITVFTPLKNFGVKPLDRVGVVGLGGLGHLAVQFAAAMGCEVTVFSQSLSKKDEAKALGATHFLSTRDEEAMKQAAESQDFILVTADQIDEKTFNSLVSCLEVSGKICFVGGMVTKLGLSCGAVILKELSVCGSAVGSRVDMHDMLDFAARNQIKAKINKYPMSEAGKALQDALEGKARYRIVLEQEKHQQQ